ncbi:MAG: response regulator [Prevotella sp.]|nr:response regulator [Prevotella sp.]
MKRPILLLILCLQTVFVCAASQLQLSSRQISTRDGLSGNTINELLQDREGYVWMATNNGLSRYDGYSIVNYTTIDNGQGEVERIGRIVYDSDEQLLWLSTAIYTNACYDLQKKRFVNWSDEPERQLNKFFLSSQGMFFYGMSFGVRQVKNRQVIDYRKENNRLPSNEVLMILEDKSHRIWMPTDKGVCVLQPNGETAILLPNEKIIAAATDGEGTFFLTQKGEVVGGRWMVEGGRWKVEGGGRTIARIPAPAKVNTCFVWQKQMMIFTADGTYAVDTRNGKTTTLAITNGLNQGECNGYHFIANESGHLWIFPPQGAMQSLLLIPNAHFSSNKGRKFHIAADNAGRFFIATYGNGLFVWKPGSEELAHFTANDEKALFNTNYLTYAICDYQDNIWIGSEGAGAYCLTKQADGNRLLLPEPSHQGDWANAISALASHPADSTIVIGTRWGGLYRYSPAKRHLEKQASLTARITALYFDRQGRLWTGTDKEGIYVEGRHIQQGSGKGALTVNHITTICQDPKGRIWIGTQNGGLFVANAGDIDHLQFRQYLAEEMNKSRIKSIVVDNNGRLWVGTNNGIYCTDSRKADITEKDFRCYNRANGLFPHNEIFTICLGADSTLLVGASGSGVMKCRFPANGDKPAIERITIREGLPNNNVYSLLCDQRGYVWAGTEGGIACIRPQTLLVRTFGQNEVATERCALQTADGAILIGTLSGLFIASSNMKPETSNLKSQTSNLKSQTSARPLVACKARNLKSQTSNQTPSITDLHVNGLSLLEQGRPDVHELSHDENSLAFHFSDFRYDASSQTLYQYYLEGAENSWQAPTTNHQADYRDLKPGRYVFHLRSQNNDGEWQEEISYAVTILHPWYLRWWAWIIYLLLATLIGWYLYRNWKEKFDLHQQMKLERQLTEFRVQLFTNITHEFRTPLAIIKGAVDKLQGDRATLQTAQRGTQRMLRLVNQFMEFRKVTTGNLQLHLGQADIVGFVKNIYQDFWSLAQQKSIQLTFTPFAREYQTYFDSEIIETVFYNLLSNAIKYTPEGGSVQVRIRKGSLNPQPSTISIEVSDSGTGISPERQEALFKPFMQGLASQGGMGIGLYTAKKMAEVHHGSLSYAQPTDTTPSTFTFNLPVDADAYSADELSESLTPHTSHLKPQTSNLKSQTSNLPPSPLNDINIAIIEDDPDMMEQIRTEMGVYFHVTCYSNGRQAYEGITERATFRSTSGRLQGKNPQPSTLRSTSGRLQGKNPQPSLIISDVMLPDMDGYEIVKRLKSQPATAALPVIMLTALDDETHQIRAYEAGADDYMVKPCNWRLLVARSMQLIKWKLSSEQETSNLNPQTSNLKPQTSNLNPQSSNLNPQTSNLIKSQADKLFLDRLAMFVAQHMRDEDFNVDQLSQLMTMGRTKFYGRVKELTGLSPNKYLMQARMKKAADLLADGELTVSEVSYQVGIQDPSYFNKCFKAQYGVTPSKYTKPVT